MCFALTSSLPRPQAVMATPPLTIGHAACAHLYTTAQLKAWSMTLAKSSNFWHKSSTGRRWADEVQQGSHTSSQQFCSVGIGDANGRIFSNDWDTQALPNHILPLGMPSPCTLCDSWQVVRAALFDLLTIQRDRCENNAVVNEEVRGSGDLISWGTAPAWKKLKALVAPARTLLEREPCPLHLVAVHCRATSG